jgi:hypothetical protein
MARVLAMVEGILDRAKARSAVGAATTRLIDCREDAKIPGEAIEPLLGIIRFAASVCRANGLPCS